MPAPSQGAYVDALRPACASWTPNGTPWLCENSMIGAHARAWSSFHRPVSCGAIRPSGTTAVASDSTRPARPIANDP